jgi:hypothetical protein
MEKKQLDTDEKGCVYFFKHIGLSPTKIGYSLSPSPIDRFEQFKTYAPYGAELVGFIQSDDAKSLETELHQKFAHARMKGEWFELDEVTIQKTIKFYSNIEQVEARNAFEILWAKKIQKEKNEVKEMSETEIFIKQNFAEDNLGFITTYDIMKMISKEIPYMESSFKVGKVLSKMGFQKRRSNTGGREWGYKVKVIK